MDYTGVCWIDELNIELNPSATLPPTRVRTYGTCRAIQDEYVLLESKGCILRVDTTWIPTTLYKLDALYLAYGWLEAASNEIPLSQPDAFLQVPFVLLGTILQVMDGFDLTFYRRVWQRLEEEEQDPLNPFLL